MKILLVDPDKLLGQTYKEALQNGGHEVVWRRSGQTALDTLDEQMPDVIVLELQLDQHGGMEFLYELRSHADWLNVPVVIHTLNPKAAEKMFTPALTELGVAAVLYKPNTSLHQLLQALRRYMPTSS